MSEREFRKLFSPISSLYGVKPSTAKMLERLAGPRIIDLLYHLPINITLRKEISHVSQATPGETVTFKARILKHQGPIGRANGRLPYRVYCRLGDNMITLAFFNARRPYMLHLLPINETCVISGKLELYKGQWQVTHPDYVGPLETLKEWVGYSSSYPLTQTLTQKTLKRLIQGLLYDIPSLGEWLSPMTLKRHPQWKSWRESLISVHRPQSEQDIVPTNPARERLAYDELLVHQIALKLVRHVQRRQGGVPKVSTGAFLQKALASLPFTLTDDQQKVFKEIQQDMASSTRMNRLLQGDVGSGKTVVAFLAAIIAIENGFQVAFMAPTEILIRQHHYSLYPLCEPLGIKIEVLTGKDKKSHKEKVYEAVKSGESQILLGTHALIQDDLTFHNLGLIVIDEQHRFGVGQRLKLAQKGKNLDCLTMTATPIPRTLMMAAYGDLDTSQLRQKPAGRKEIQTKCISLNRLDEVVEGIKRAVTEGQKVYWVCPLVEESEKIDLAAAQSRFEFLDQHLPGQVGLIHGRMKSVEKTEVMRRFIEGEYKALIATTVIEVGVSVEDATIMVIEHAERFGLAQLHQLRGRVGRGIKEGTCLLLYDPALGEAGRARLNIMRQTNDGFEIAEEDWTIRGGGEILGLRQSGLPNFKFVDWGAHTLLLREALQEAESFVANFLDKKESPYYQAIKDLLYLFDKEETVPYLTAG